MKRRKQMTIASFASAVVALSSAFAEPGFCQTPFGPPGTMQQLGGALLAAPRGLLTGDFNRDGRADVLLGSDSTFVVASFGTGQGEFAGTIGSVVSSTPQSTRQHAIESADFDADGDLDVVVVERVGTTDQVQIILNAGNGAFVASGGAPVIGLANGPKHFAIGNVIGSAAPELIAIEPTKPIGILRVYSFSPVSGLALAFTALLPATPRSVHAGDVDGDGLVDVIVDRDSGTPFQDVIDVFLNSTGGLSAVPAGTFGWNASLHDPSVAIIDVNQDGIGDVVGYGAGDPNSATFGTVTTRFGALVNPLASSATVSALPLPLAPADGAAVDVDSDGTLELRASRRFIRPPTPSGGGTFLDAPDPGFYYWGLSWSELWSAFLDVDGDSDLDYVGLRAIATYGPGGVGGPSWTWVIKVSKNESILDSPCGPAIATPAALVGQPSPGNPAFFIALFGAPPGAAAALGVSTERGHVTLGSCVISLSLDPANLLLPAPPLGLTNVDGSGLAYFLLPIPAGFPLYHDFYLQWLVEDPAGPVSLGGSAYSLSRARKIIVW
jgi:FG-GAP-like repeat